MVGIAYVHGPRLRRCRRIENLVRSGRVSRTRGWLGRILGITPILELTPEAGKVTAIDRVRGSTVRIGVVHADAAQIAAGVVRQVEHRFQPRERLVADATAALGAHVGPGIWAVPFQIDEPADDPDRNISLSGAL